MGKSQATTNKHFFTFTFLYKKIIFCWKTYLENIVYTVTFVYSFFGWQVIGNAVIKSNAHTDMHWL